MHFVIDENNWIFAVRGMDIGTEIQEGEIMPVEIPVPEQTPEPVPERELEEVEP